MPKLSLAIALPGLRTGSRALRGAALVMVLMGLLFSLPISSASAHSRDSGKDLSLSDGNDYPTGIWSDGTTMWVADFEDSTLYAYRMSDKSRDADKDFGTLAAAGNDDPVGIWSDGITMWVSDFTDGKLYAYDMSTRGRDAGKDFDTLKGAGNYFPEGIWSDGTTMLVADTGTDKIYGYNLLEKTRNPDKDLALAIGNDSPAGIWSDGITMWVSNWYDDWVYAYDMSTKARDTDKEFDTLAAGNNSSECVWSDGITMWVADRVDAKLYAYTLPPGVIVSPMSLTVAEGGSSTYQVALNVAPTADVTVDITADGDVSASPTSLTFTTSNWSTAQAVMVSADDDDDTTNDAVALQQSISTADSDYSGISVPDVKVTVTDNDSAGVVVSPTSLTVAEGGSGSYTIKLGSQPSADVTVSISGGGDVSASPTGLTFSSSTWSAAQTVTVSALQDDDETDDTHTISHSVGGEGASEYAALSNLPGVGVRVVDDDATAVGLADGNENPTGIWSDGTSMWVADDIDRKVYAYNIWTKDRDTGKDFNTLDAANLIPTGIWSDGTTMWVAERSVASLYAYRMSDGERDTGKDFGTLRAAGNTVPRGIWSDGTTMWVADSSDGKIYAYSMTTKTRDSGKDFGTLRAAGNTVPRGIWSDGTTMWVADSSDGKIYAYSMTTRTRDSGKDFSTLKDAGNTAPQGIWSDGATMWVADSVADRLYAYDMPGGEDPSIWSATLTGGTDGSNVGFDLLTGLGSLSPRNFRVDGNASDNVVDSLYLDDGGNLLFIIGGPMPATFTLDVDGFRFSSQDAETTESDEAYSYSWSGGELSLSVGDDVEVSLVISVSADVGSGPVVAPPSQPTNSPAAGAPTISGTVQVGETLTADTSGITDGNGMDGARFTYQWLWVDAETETEVGTDFHRYRLVLAAAGKQIKLRVTFSDDSGTDETLTSAAVGPVLVVPPPPKVLVRNTDQTLARFVGIHSSNPRLGQGFTTGAHDDGYALKSIRIRFSVVAEPARAATELTATINTANGAEPGGVLCTLDAPSSYVENRLHTFTAPVGGCALSASTTYYLVLERSAEVPGVPNLIALSSTAANAESPDSALDWSIADQRYYATGGHWRSATDRVLLLEVRGYAVDTSGNIDFQPDLLKYAGFDLHADNSGPKSIWSDGETLWVGDDSAGKVFAYRLYDDPNTDANEYGTRDPDRDVGNLNEEDFYVTGHGSYLYVGEESKSGDSRDVFAYSLPGLTRAPDQDFPYWDDVNDVGDVSIIRGMATDGQHLWITNTTSNAYAFRLHDDESTADTDEYGTQDSDRDLRIPGSGQVTGLFTDGQTIWGTRYSSNSATVRSLNVADGTEGSYDFTLDDENDHAYGIWSNGVTFYVTDYDDGRIYIYRPFHDDSGDFDLTPTSSPATGLPTIGGTAQAGQTLTAGTEDIADEDGLDNVAFTYQWISNNGIDDSDIEGATGSTYEVSADDVGNTIKVRVAFTDDRNFDESLTSAPTEAVITRANSPATGLPTIGGTAQAGQTLTAGTEDIADEDGLDNVAFTYQWISNNGIDDSDIEDATASTYELTDDDVGNTIKVRVTFTDDGDFDESLASAPTEAVITRANTASYFDLHADNSGPKSIWSDGETLWVGDDSAGKVFAYRLYDDPNTDANEYGTRDPDRDVGNLNEEDFYVTGHGSYLYVGEESKSGDSRDVFAYSLPGLTRAPDQDFPYWDDVNDVGDVSIIRGMATDGQHLWITNTTSNAYAFRLHDDESTADTDEYGTQDSDRDLRIPGSGQVTGLFTDGRTMWGVRFGSNDSVARSVKVSDGTEAGYDFPLHEDNDHAYGIWSDGVTFYVIDYDDGMIYTYHGVGGVVRPFVEDAETAAALVGNTGQSVDTGHGLDSTGAKRAQAFTTGNNRAGYALASVGIEFGDVSDPSPAPTDLEATLNSDGGGVPGDALCTLIAPASLSERSVNTFAAPASGTTCPALMQETTYFVVVERVRATGSGAIAVSGTASDAEDTEAAEGWSIADGSATYSSQAAAQGWASDASSYKIEVRGSFINNPAAGEVTVTGTPQVERTLAAAVADPSDDDGLTGATYSYRWLRIDGATETNIGTGSSSYTLVAGDLGKRIRVRVAFVDDRGNYETLASEATAAVEVFKADDQPGTVSLFPARTRVGTVLSATLSDPDGLAGGGSGPAASLGVVSWSWARSSDGTAWTGVEAYGEGDSYVPTDEDEGMLLKAEASYTDGHGSGKSAQAVSPAVVGAREPGPELTVTVIVRGLSHPWGIDFTPDGTMLFTQRAGVLNARLTNGAVKRVAADLGDLLVDGFAGLQALAVDPDFTTNRRFYTLQGHAGREMQVIAWTIDASYDEATRVVDPLVKGMPMGPGPWHSGGRLLFGPEGYLWIVTGDGRVVTGAQDLTSLGGKVLRVDPRTGAGAPGNPFGPSSPVYAYGFRNPQGLARRPGTDQMWLVEHGPKHDDEINLLAPGGNYGWDPIPDDGTVVFYDYSDEAGVPMTDLAKFPSARQARWSSGFPTLATSGAVFLDGPQWGEWEGRLAVATLKTKSLRVFEFTEQSDFASQIVVPELDGSHNRLRTPVLGPDGALYIATSNRPGNDRILRVTANRAATGAPSITGTTQVGETLTANTTGVEDADGLTNVSYSYQWMADGVDIQNATGSTHKLVFPERGKTIQVRVSFTDDAGNAEALTSAATVAVVAAPNREATGEPTITGTTQVGETLTVDTSEIADEDGLNNVSYRYQWVAGGTDIDGATGFSYLLTSSEQGQTVQVRVTFTDAADNEETLTSAATVAVQPGGNAWSATMTVETRDGFTGYSYWGDPHLGSLSATEVEWDGKTHYVRYIFLKDGELRLGLNEEMFSTGFVLSVGDEEFGSANAMVDKSGASYRFRWDDPGLGWSDGNEVSVNLVQSDQNTPALRAPTISGTAQVDETLTADTTGIEDADGLTNVSYGYQWMADGVDMQNATSSTHKLVFPDQGKTIQVRVTFTDDRDNQETLTSNPTGPVTAAPNRQATGQPTIGGTPQVDQTLTADTSNIADQDGLTHVSYSYQWIAGVADIDGATASTYTLTIGEVGNTIKVRVTFTDDRGHEETLTSAAIEAVAPKPNTPATGAPTINGTPRVEQRLTADTSAIVDTDGLTNVSYGYQWIAGDGAAESDIDGATASTYTLTIGEVGNTVKVRVSFTDDRNFEESLTSAATNEVAATVPGAPQHLSVTHRDTGLLDVYWEAPASDGGSEITGYRVQWKETAESWEKSEDVLVDTTSGTTHTITGLTDGVEYRVRIRAVNGVGDGPPSAEATGMPQEVPVWSATLTVGTAENFAGYSIFGTNPDSSILGALSSDTITLDGSSHTVVALGILNGKMTFTPSRKMTAGFVLVVGTVEFPSIGASIRGLAFQWDGRGLHWSEGEEVAVRLNVTNDDTPAPSR